MKNRWPFVFFVVLLAFVFYALRHPGARTIPYSQFVALVDGGYVQSGAFDNETFSGTTLPGAPGLPNASFTVILPPPASPSYGLAVEKLLRQNVHFEFRRPWLSDGLSGVLMTVLFPLLFVAFIWIFFMRQAQSGAGRRTE